MLLPGSNGSIATKSLEPTRLRPLVAVALRSLSNSLSKPGVAGLGCVMAMKVKSPREALAEFHSAGKLRLCVRNYPLRFLVELWLLSDHQSHKGSLRVRARRGLSALTATGWRAASGRWGRRSRCRARAGAPSVRGVHQPRRKSETWRVARRPGGHC